MDKITEKEKNNQDAMVQSTDKPVWNAVAEPEENCAQMNVIVKNKGPKFLQNERYW